jgi:multisubunit Na+/H+ antiporter MnhB subunit
MITAFAIGCIIYFIATWIMPIFTHFRPLIARRRGAARMRLNNFTVVVVVLLIMAPLTSATPTAVTVTEDCVQTAIPGSQSAVPDPPIAKALFSLAQKCASQAYNYHV